MISVMRSGGTDVAACPRPRPWGRDRRTAAEGRGIDDIPVVDVEGPRDTRTLVVIVIVPLYQRRWKTPPPGNGISPIEV
jgi:hypothetical protein